MKTERRIIIGDKAREYYKELIDNEVGVGQYQHPTLNYDGGWWIENGRLMAFDNSSYTANIEEFANFEEAKKYANGVLAMTKGGFEI